LKSAGESGKAIELYGNKVNVGVIDNPDVALAYTGTCGDTIKLYLKMNNNKVIEDAKFQYLGCPASAACGSNLTQIIKGKRLQETKEITEDDVLMELNGLPDNECHCAELAVTTLYKAISTYEAKEKKF
jgi:NifU-like protein involved in Fe-S cluster formation